MRSLDIVQQQSAFCADLMARLNDKIQNARIGYGRITYHTRMENDVIRLRRELNELRDMLMQYGYKDDRE